MVSIMAMDLLDPMSATGKPFYAESFSLLEVLGQYDSFFRLELTDEDKRNLIEELFGPPGRSAMEEGE
jgi:hypothetical protein